MPISELLTNSRPLTSPASTGRTSPRQIAWTASVRSIGTPMSRAKWFKVPRGSTPNGTFEPARTPATALTLPSPPPTTIMST